MLFLLIYAMSLVLAFFEDPVSNSIKFALCVLESILHCFGLVGLSFQSVRGQAYFRSELLMQ